MTAAQQSREQTTSVASAHDKILIVDFGSQVTQLIARRRPQRRCADAQRRS